MKSEKLTSIHVPIVGICIRVNQFAAKEVSIQELMRIDISCELSICSLFCDARFLIVPSDLNKHNLVNVRAWLPI